MGDIQRALEEMPTSRAACLVPNTNPLQLLEPKEKFMADVAVGGALMTKTCKAAYELLVELAYNNYQWLPNRFLPRRMARMLDLDLINHLIA